MDKPIKTSQENRTSPDSNRPTRKEAENAVTTLLEWIGEDVKRKGLLDTPTRFVKAYDELFSGYGQDPFEVLQHAIEDSNGYDDMVLVRDIAFHSHCEHHIAPIIGKAHVTYLPDGKMLGLSKIARVVDIFARRLQTQEYMTVQIAKTIDQALKPKGVAVMIQAQHMCMMMRGVSKQSANTTTTCYTGDFHNSLDTQNKFLALLGVNND